MARHGVAAGSRVDAAPQSFRRLWPFAEGLAPEALSLSLLGARPFVPQAIVDPGTQFLELSALAAWEMYDGGAHSAGIVTGIGLVHGVEVLFVANDATVKGGARAALAPAPRSAWGGGSFGVGPQPMGLARSATSCGWAAAPRFGSCLPS